MLRLAPNEFVKVPSKSSFKISGAGRDREILRRQITVDEDCTLSLPSIENIARGPLLLIWAFFFFLLRVATGTASKHLEANQAGFLTLQGCVLF